MPKPNLPDLILGLDHDITRHFQSDYILFDAVFLALYVALLLRRGRMAPLYAGLVCAPILYAIDGLLWTVTGVREYTLPAPWVKHPVDFMMDVSYAIVAFSWVWIAFERRSARDVAGWTALLFAGWLLVPLASQHLHLNDASITTVRHMRGQVWAQIAAVAAGYLLLFALGYRLRTVLYVFWIGCMLTFMMESALLLTGIRPSGLQVLAYETLILTNQGVPYLYVIWDKILPAMRQRFAAGGRAS